MARLPSDLLTELSDPRAMRVRRNLQASQTATYVACPHCLQPAGFTCVTFPRGNEAQFPHAKRVHARWVELGPQ